MREGEFGWFYFCLTPQSAALPAPLKKGAIPTSENSAII